MTTDKQKSRLESINEIHDYKEGGVVPVQLKAICWAVLDIVNGKEKTDFVSSDVSEEIKTLSENNLIDQDTIDLIKEVVGPTP